jgi:hypothetical protein
MMTPQTEGHKSEVNNVEKGGDGSRCCIVTTSSSVVNDTTDTIAVLTKISAHCSYRLCYH